MKHDRNRPGRPLLWLQTALSLVGCGCLGVVAGAWADAQVFQASQEHVLTRPSSVMVGPSRSTTTGTETPVVGPPSADAPWRLEFPRLDHSVMVAEGVDEQTLSRAPGHFPETAVPGPTGNVAIAGHRDVDFRPLREMREGEEIVLSTPARSFRYLVESLEVVAPTAVEVLDPTAEPTLTLVTCHPFDHVGPAPDRYVVRARMVE